MATKGFFILPSELFANIYAKAVRDSEWAKDHLNEALEKVFKHIEASAQGTPSETNIKGLFDDIDVNSNKLTQENIEKIVGLYTDRVDVDYTAKVVPNSAIAEQEYNLSVSTYVEQEDKREVIDIQTLNAEIKRIVAREDALRKKIDAIIAEIEGDEVSE